MSLAHHLISAAMLLALAGSARAQDAKLDFQKDVWPILEKNCVECHRPTFTDKDGRVRRPKGGLVLDSRKGIEAGAKGDPVLVPGKPDDSTLYKLVSLPPDDEDRMPPAADKKEPLAKAQIEILHRWIAQGADFGAWKGNEAAAAGNGSDPTVAIAPDVFAPLAKGLTPLTADVIAKASVKARVEPVLDDGPLLRVSFPSQADKITDADLAPLQPLCAHVAILQLGRTSVGDGACALAAKMPRLVRLDLRQTDITDKGLLKLGALPELRELNLFGTKVTDACLPALDKLPKLEHLWTWQTSISAAAIVKLREQRPTLKVTFVPDLPEPSDAGDRPRRRGGKK
jgi:hypothetical protein